ncbi:MAG: hypothetical protein ACQCN6_10370 [Candidatus Bathyarchaeia archaeon]|jgi:uncharacterized membrane protein YozB (DUF420 family)
MKSIAILFGIIILCLSIIAPAVYASAVPSVGVKEGDWIEYNVTIVGDPPPVHRGVVGMRLEVLGVEGAAFPVNLTEWYANGTVKSAIWDFNFTEGNTQGWIIIPANLNPGDTFFDNYSKIDKNILIQSQEQKTVLGATRTITFGNDSYRDKYWDKTTGVFVGSTEVFQNWNTTVEATKTNLWTPQVAGLGQTVFFGLAAAIVLVAIASSVLFVFQRKKPKKPILQSPLHRKIVTLALLLALVVTFGAVSFIPVQESDVPLSFREINLIMQTLWTSLVVVSMWFRKKGNYFMHGLIMVAVVSVTLVTFSAILVMSPPGSGSMDTYFSSASNVIGFIAHGVLSIPAIAFGVWLVVLWRPNSTTFPAKSKRVALLTAVFWVLSYAVGVVDFLVRTSVL